MTVHWPHQALSICLLLATLCLSPFTPTSAQSELAFGENIGLLLTTTDEYEDRNVSAKLASTGESAFGYSFSTASYSHLPEVKQYLWNIESNSLTQSLTIFEPVRTITTALIDDADYPLFQLSPNGYFLASVKANLLEIQEFPSLEINQAFPNLNIGSLQWTWDSQQLFYTINSNIYILDVGTGQTIEADVDWIEPDCFNYCLGDIVAIDRGWAFSRSTDFMVCTQNMNECNQYKTDDQLFGNVTISPHGDLILRDFWSPNEQSANGYEIWERVDDTSYGMISFIPNDQRSCACSFSPTLQYIVVLRSGTYKFYRYPQLEFVQELENIDEIEWLPDGEHLITFDGSLNKIYLYKIGIANPLDTIDLTELPRTDSRIHKNWFPTVNVEIEVSSSGSIIMLNLGWGALIISIEQG
jgi:hypothetical protein